MQESELTTYLAQGLKELAMSAGLRILAIAASDRDGLQSKRMRLHDMRGSSAIQYEADIGAILKTSSQSFPVSILSTTLRTPRPCATG